jgi:curved DNA-binding protein CbpA
MSTKDYYKILKVRPNASAGEIKHAYRRLALKYHPDRNPHDALAAAVFSEVAEAYKILSNSEARTHYNYQRYYTAVQEYSRPAEPIETLLLRSLELKKQIAALDPYRFNGDALLYSIKQLLPEPVDLLLKTDPALSKQFLETIAVCSERLSSAQTNDIARLVQPLFVQYEWLKMRMETLTTRQKKKERWEKYKVILVIFIALALCALIFLSSR